VATCINVHAHVINFVIYIKNRRALVSLKWHINISALQDMSLKYYHILKLDSKWKGVSANIFLVICHHRVIRLRNIRLVLALSCIWLTINKINWHRSCCTLICVFLATPKQKEWKKFKMQEDITLQRVQTSNDLMQFQHIWILH
jgi:hypothetical protein